MYYPFVQRFLREPWWTNWLTTFEHISILFYRHTAKGICQSTLLALTEDWRQSLDGGHFVGAILMDLSKAFDCLPHRLLLEKLRAYNLAESAVSLLGSYLSDREQCVKIGNAQRASLPMYKGVPQGTILAPSCSTFSSMTYFTLLIILNCSTRLMITQYHTQAHISTQ